MSTQLPVSMSASEPQDVYVEAYRYRPVPTRKQVQIMLGEEELAAGPSALGAADWIANGLRLEETKCVYWMFVVSKISLMLV